MIDRRQLLLHIMCCASEGFFFLDAMLTVLSHLYYTSVTSNKRSDRKKNSRPVLVDAIIDDLVHDYRVLSQPKFLFRAPQNKSFILW